MTKGDVMAKASNLIGQVFGRLTVVSRTVRRTSSGVSRVFWVCACSCGNQHTVKTAELKSGRVRSCGCLRKDLLSGNTLGLKHGHARGGLTRIYRIWCGMKCRCSNLKLKNYGASGISVCQEWKSFPVFEKWAKENGYSDSLEIDRIDGKLGYFPSNCRWVTELVQQRNKARVKLLTFKGRTQFASEWELETGIRKATILARLKLGWSVEDALTLPNQNIPGTVRGPNRRTNDRHL